MLGLVGAHRTGKTSLAKAYAAKHGWTFAETSVSAIFRELGYNPAEKFDFATRLMIQEQILQRMGKFYKEVGAVNVITDRTPLDFLMYTMAEAIGESVSDQAQARFKRYASDCFDMTNRHFGTVLVVQPGIPLVHEEGKAALNEAYIDHLNVVAIGLCSDERQKVPHFYIPRSRIDMTERIESVEIVAARSLQRAMEQSASLDSRAFH